MAQAISFPGSNTILRAPEGREGDVAPLECFRNGVVIVSCWQLSADELNAVVQSGGKVFLSVFGGKTTVPAYVGSEDTTREVIADYGPVWAR